MYARYEVYTAGIQTAVLAPSRLGMWQGTIVSEDLPVSMYSWSSEM